MSETASRIDSTLSEVFGFKEFRNGQREIIESIVSGGDTLAVMPTGGGKSICYQLPAVITHGVALVVSPLISLMKDQVDSLAKIGVNAAYINSSLSVSEIQSRVDMAMAGRIKLLYVAPERFESRRFLEQMRSLRLSFLAVDEAHCISEWGHDFRPSYKSIGKIFEFTERIPIIALTATATPEVQDDICASLALAKPKRMIRGFDRPNLSYFTRATHAKTEAIEEIIRNTKKGSTIVYCGSRKIVDEYTDTLKRSGIPALPYHAGYPDKYRNFVQDKFISDSAKVIVATNAFGMGIDKPDVRNVIHTGFTGTLEAYYQEAGRAGRDGLPAVCTMLFEERDRKLQEYFIDSSYPDIHDIRTLYNIIFDQMQTAVGNRPNAPLLIDESHLANLAAMPLYKTSSILRYFERAEIIRRGTGTGVTAIQFTTSRERIDEFYENTSADRRKVIDALLRTAGQTAFDRQVDFDVNDLMRKNKISLEEFNAAVNVLVGMKLVNYRPSGEPFGIYFKKERVDNRMLGIEQKEITERKKIAQKKLDVVIRYAETAQCKRSYILNYFQDDETKGDCGQCSSCLATYGKRKSLSAETTDLRNKCISALYQLNGKFGLTVSVDFIAGKKNEKLTSYTLDRAECFGIGSKFTPELIKDTIKQLIAEGFVFMSSSMYPVIFLSNAGRSKLLYYPKQFDFGTSFSSTDLNMRAFRDLDKLRSELAASEAKVPRSVLSDVALQRMVKKLPKTIDELKEIPGCSDSFASRYGRQFLKAISALTTDKTEAKNERIKISIAAEKSVVLLKNGSSVSETAMQLGIKPVSVVKHIEEALHSGDEFDYSESDDRVLLIKMDEYLDRHPGATLAELKTVFPDKELYRLRLCMAIINNKKRMD